MKVNLLNAKEYALLPPDPGVYEFLNKASKVIYVGKAKNLKKRVSSYFTKSLFENRKTLKLVSEARFIEFTIVNSEFDALLLENNLIKQNQPKYNIQLRDDKSFPYILITNERFPRIFSTRRVIKGSGNYYGPYSSVVAMNNVLDLIRSLYTIRTCRLDLSERNIKAKKFKVCLEYHIGNCQGPCEGLQMEENYAKDMEQATAILKGNIGLVEKHFKEEMKRYAVSLEFEKAQMLKEKLSLLTKFQSKSLVVNRKISDADVFTIISDENYAYLNYLRIKNGAIISSQTREVKIPLDENESDILTSLVFDIQKTFSYPSTTIISNRPLTVLPDAYKNFVPLRGDKRKLVELSLKNAFQYKRERQRQYEKESKDPETLIRLMNDLRLSEVPKHIECFDNSNFQGTTPVAAMVCFREGKPSKKEYRHFNIKTVQGPDDFASMREVVTRRYRKVKNTGETFPNLIIIDGGKGQLNAAFEALRDLGLDSNIHLIGIAKRLEEIYTIGDQFPLHLSKSSGSLKLIQQIRDETHRFAITFHRSKRSKQLTRSELENIEGIGPQTISILLHRFKSIKKLNEAAPLEIEKAVGKARAQRILEYYQKKRKSKSSLKSRISKYS
ncbi:MAG TPA: excinuclease ABC subunit UvrC [Cyclobacteriaceae bacterium]|jgi:excinuclease ABC subunit C